MKLEIVPHSRCEYCHPETCACPDYVLKLNGKTISSGYREDMESVKKTIQDARKKP
jgi:hypothetical protein